MVLNLLSMVRQQRKQASRSRLKSVLMEKHPAQRRYESVVAPTDMSDASAHAIKAVLSTGLIGDKGVTLLHAFLTLMTGRMPIAGVDQAGIDGNVANERPRHDCRQPSSHITRN